MADGYDTPQVLRDVHKKGKLKWPEDVRPGDQERIEVALDKLAPKLAPTDEFTAKGGALLQGGGEGTGTVDPSRVAVAVQPQAARIFESLSLTHTRADELEAFLKNAGIAPLQSRAIAQAFVADGYDTPQVLSKAQKTASFTWPAQARHGDQIKIEDALGKLAPTPAPPEATSETVPPTNANNEPSGDGCCALL